MAFIWKVGMDLEQSRFNMVEQQIRTWDVLDQEVLKLLFELRREEFVPAAYRSLAFVDMEIPLGYGRGDACPKARSAHVAGIAGKRNRQDFGDR